MKINKLKLIITAIAAAAVTCSLGAVSAAAHTDIVPTAEQAAVYRSTTEDGLLTYSIYKDKVTIESCDSSATVVNIPAEIEGITVTYIGNEAFKNCSSLTSVTIPDGVLSIDFCAFMYCSSLESVTMGSGLKEIGSQAFYECSKLDGVILPDSVTHIGTDAFYGSGITSIKIPTGVTEIYGYTFCDCPNLTSVTLHDGITSIAESAFRYCTELRTINIPDSVTSLGHSVFYNCLKLTDITIPEGITTIRANTFYKCKSLKNFTIPDSVTTIANMAFGECTSLTDIQIPDSVTNIQDYAFYHCAGLTAFDFPDKLTNIGVGAFRECTQLTDITIPDGVTTIGSKAFNQVPNMKKIYLPASLTTLSADTFDSVAIICYRGSEEQWAAMGVSYPWAKICCNYTEITAPVNVKATLNGINADISWDSVKPATSYSVYRSESAAGEKTLLGTTDTTAYTDTTTALGKTYYYSVTAYNDNAEELSGYSAAASVTTPDPVEAPTLPASPFYCLNDIITVKWNAVEGATSYRVYRATSETGTKTLLKTTGILRYTDQPKSGTYYYFIAAYNSKTGQLSDYSAPIKVSLITRPVIYTYEYENGGVYMTWNTVNTATSYRVFRTDADTGVKTQIKTVGFNHCNDTDIQAGKTYTYTVQAFNNNLKIISASAAAKTVTIPSGTKPVITSAEKITEGVALSWDGVKDSTSYRIYRADRLTGKKTLLKSTGILRFTDTTAVSGKTYYYFVAAYNSKTGVLSDYSAVKSITA